MTQPLFIVLDGIDGCGKTTQGKRLKAHLGLAGHETAYFEDPGGTPAATRIREILFDKDCPLSPKEQLLLYTAARNSLATAIKDRLNKGQHVVCSRWLSSTLAYQGFMGGLGADLCRSLHHQLRIPDPDLYLLMDVDPAVGHARKHGAGERFESKDLGWKTRLNYEFGTMAEILELHSGVVAEVVNANGTEDEVFDRILTKARVVFPGLV